MGPFDSPPSTPPVSFDPPLGAPRRRSLGRTAAVAAACLVLIAAGVLAVAQFASGGDADVANAAQAVDDSTPPTPAPETTPAPTTVPADELTPDEDQAPDERRDDTPELDGRIVIQLGDGEPIVIDLGDLGDLAGGSGDLGDLGKLEECVGGLAFDIDLEAAPGELSLPGLPGLSVDGDDLTVAGPNGLSVLDFGDGDGSVTITKQDGEITITSEGDVEVDELTALDASAPLPSLPPLPDFDEIYRCLEDAAG
jgi:hypothetical protein